MMIRAEIGLDPWTVFAQGLEKQTGISIGVVVVLIGFGVLLMWIPLRQRPGVGTVANVLLIGPVMDLVLPLIATPDELWARIVYDFAVAHFAKTMERRQLLASMTPLYLGWVASFVAEVGALDGAAAEARIESLCAAFEREKRYLIARWRWPDTFNP